MQILMLICLEKVYGCKVGLFIAEKSCHELNMIDMDKKPLNCTLSFHKTKLITVELFLS